MYTARRREHARYHCRVGARATANADTTGHILSHRGVVRSTYHVVSRLHAVCAGEALQSALESGKLEMIREMLREWPFFRARLSMLEMVFAKSDHTLSAHYDQLLVEPDLASVGQRLRHQLQRDIDTLLSILESDQLLAHDQWVQQSIGLRPFI